MLAYELSGFKFKSCSRHVIFQALLKSFSLKQGFGNMRSLFSLHKCSSWYGWLKNLYRNLYNWALALQNEDINEKTKILTGTLMNLFNNFIPYPCSISKFDTNPYGWRTRLCHIWRKDRNLLRNTTATPRVIIKICWLIQQLNAQIFYPTDTGPF